MMVGVLLLADAQLRALRVVDLIVCVVALRCVADYMIGLCYTGHVDRYVNPESLRQLAAPPRGT